MKLKHMVLTVAIMLMSFGLVKAKEPISGGQQPSKANLIIEEEISTIALASEVNNVDSHDVVPMLLDVCYHDSCNLNLSFQFNDKPDSIDFSIVEHYIKNVMPIVKSVDSKNVELMEIL